MKAHIILAVLSCFSPTASVTVSFSNLTLIGSTEAREDPRYFYCTLGGICFGNFGGSSQTGSGILDGKLVYASPQKSKDWIHSSSPGPQMVLVVNSTFSYDFGDLCAPYVTHSPLTTPKQEFHTTWVGLIHTSPSGSSLQRENVTISFEGLPSTAVRLQMHHPFSRGNGEYFAIMGAQFSPTTPKKFVCCNETLTLFKADKQSEVNGIPRRWTFVSIVLQRNDIPISPPSEEGPNECSFMFMNGGNSMMGIVRTDGGDGVHHLHRPFVLVSTNDFGNTWARRLMFDKNNNSIGSARPQLIGLSAGGSTIYLVTGGRPGLNLWVSADKGVSWDTWNMAKEHNQLLSGSGIANYSTYSFCPAFVNQSDGKHMGHATWSSSTGYTGLSKLTPSTALYCYDSSHGGSGGYPSTPPPGCQPPLSSVFCLTISIGEQQAFSV
eukprot:m.61193 g.61193  ORF g.61193 m.61193 type:complete len:436 (+) comp11385_c0_seq3:249-1556(+)